MKKLAIALMCSWITAFNASAQDPHFSQFYANPLYLNPALTGSVGQTRLITNYRGQWASINKAYETYHASLDGYLNNCNSGIGVTALYDRMAGGLLNTGAVGVSYAYQLRITRNLSFTTGLRATLVQKSMNWNAAVWDDMIDPSQGVVYQTAQPTGQNSTYFDFSAGAMLSSPFFYLGYAADHLTTPTESLFENTDQLPIKHTLHLGVNLELANRTGAQKQILSPSLLYSRQARFEQLYMGVYYVTNGLTLGCWYRHKDALVMLVGYEFDHLKIGYSYDYTISSLQKGLTGAHEVSLSITFPQSKKPGNSFKTLSCPSF